MHLIFTDTYDGRPTFTGVVYKKTIGNYTVHNKGQVVLCELSNRLRKNLIYPTADPASLPHRVQKVIELEHMDPLAVGDEVRYIRSDDGKGFYKLSHSLRNRDRSFHTCAFNLCIAHNIISFVRICSYF